MALSEKLLKILRSKTELTEKEIAQLTEKEGWGIVYSLKSKKEKRTEICFTGFSPSDKAKLIELAEENGFHVVSSVTVGLNFLCCGPNFGPSKLEKAEKQGTTILNADQFLNLLETGEMPNENKTEIKDPKEIPPSKKSTPGCILTIILIIIIVLLIRAC